MSFLDHNGESEFPYKKDTVFDALSKAVPTISGLKIDKSDKLAGRIMVKAGVSLASWGENIPIQLLSITEHKTRVQITSSPKTGIMFGGAFDLGKNRKNIERILNATSAILSKLPPEIEHSINNSVSIADELQKLKSLLESGILTQEEFNQQKAKLLK